ncbi:orotate phosphoribosyltransferase [Amphibiibacter pelophylacis]|uniref:Orotate phosphoribosyltransferase n=1 Tax=Amphibiibacter pelophylacis TaxID=1799477 RepID=A0ACC6P4T4_9BURK
MSTAATPAPSALAGEFVDFCVRHDILRFGQFVTKAGRTSPYFFNAGLFNDGALLSRLGQYYARAALDSGLEFDMVFGPAYKGITLASAMAIELARLGRNVPWAYNRKEAKDHGEGGTLVGAPLRGRVLIVDDVISDGASKREAADLIRAAGAEPVGVIIALDRQEWAIETPQGRLSGVQHVESTLGLSVIPIARLDDLLNFLHQHADMSLQLDKVEAYRRQFGAAPASA